MTTPTVRAVIATLADYYPAVSLDLIQSKRKTRLHAEPRHLAMVMLDRMGWSMTKIGNALNRHHTTVIHARHAVRIRHDPRFVERLTHEARARCGK